MLKVKACGIRELRGLGREGLSLFRIIRIQILILVVIVITVVIIVVIINRNSNNSKNGLLWGLELIIGRNHPTTLVGIPRVDES